MSKTIELIQTLISGATLLVMVIGGFKIYYTLYEHTPHSHTERQHKDNPVPLTTDGIRYPLDIRRREDR